MTKYTSAAILLLTFSLAHWACTTGSGKDSQEQTSLPAKKLLTIGGTISEVVYALGMGESIIATDRTSVYPESLQKLPSVGYRNSIKAEGVLSTGAELILTEADYLNKDVGKQLQTAGVAFHAIPNKFSLESTKSIIHQIGDILGKQVQAKELIAGIDTDKQKVDSLLKHTTSIPKVMFIYARGQGAMSVCGKGSFAESIINLAGGQLATPEIIDFKPLTPEALVSSDPDYILFFDSGLQSVGGIEGALAVQGVSQTKAGKNKNIIAMEGLYVSGFGPRVAKAAYDLALLIHPELHAQSQTLSQQSK